MKAELLGKDVFQDVQCLLTAVVVSTSIQYVYDRISGLDCVESVATTHDHAAIQDETPWMYLNKTGCTATGVGQS